jgi:hypothetical protein
LSVSIKDFYEIIHAAAQRFSQSENHCQAWYLHSPFKFTDERFVRAAEIGERVLRQIARESEFAEALTEDDALRLRLDRHEEISLASAVG